MPRLCVAYATAVSIGAIAMAMNRAMAISGAMTMSRGYK